MELNMKKTALLLLPLLYACNSENSQNIHIPNDDKGINQDIQEYSTTVITRKFSNVQLDDFNEGVPFSMEYKYNPSIEYSEHGRLLNEGAQIEAAATLHRAMYGDMPINLDQLVEKSFLKKVPPNWTYDITNNVIYKESDSSVFCESLYKKQDVSCSSDTENACQIALPKLKETNHLVISFMDNFNITQTTVNELPGAIYSLSGISGCLDVTDGDADVFYMNL
jgi:hypothetical protein